MFSWLPQSCDCDPLSRVQVSCGARSHLGRQRGFDLEASPFDQLSGAIVSPARCGQITIDKHGIYRIEQLALAQADVQFAPTGGSELAAWIEHSEQTGCLRHRSGVRNDESP